MNKLVTIAILASAGIQLNAMKDDKIDTLIEFRGEKKYILGWILASQLDPNHPFSTTSIVRADDDKLILQGDVLSLSEQDLQDVANNNYVYSPFYALLKTRLSRGAYVEVGAIILGTKDEKAGRDLHFAHMRNLIASVKK